MSVDHKICLPYLDAEPFREPKQDGRVITKCYDMAPRDQITTIPRAATCQDCRKLADEIPEHEGGIIEPREGQLELL